jgi:hypothetical protein
MEKTRDELRRLMRLGRQLPAFSFTLLEVDTQLDGDPLLAFCGTFERCALESD